MLQKSISTSSVTVGTKPRSRPAFLFHNDQKSIALSGVETAIPSAFNLSPVTLAQITPPALPEAFYPPILQNDPSSSASTPAPDNQDIQTLIGAIFSQSTPTLVDTSTLDTADIAGFLPDHSLTPGVIDPRVTQANIKSTICKKGYTASVRPPESYTEPLKKKDIALVWIG